MAAMNEKNEIVLFTDNDLKKKPSGLHKTK